MQSTYRLIYVEAKLDRHDIQHNDTHYKNTLQYDTQQKTLSITTQQNGTED